MNFNRGDLVRFRTTEEEWSDYFKENNIKSMSLRNNVLDRARELAEKYPPPLKVAMTWSQDLEFEEANGRLTWLDINWFILDTTEKTDDTSYRTTDDGFKTNDANWLPENRWF